MTPNTKNQSSASKIAQAQRINHLANYLDEEVPARINAAVQRQFDESVRRHIDSKVQQHMDITVEQQIDEIFNKRKRKLFDDMLEDPTLQEDLL
ncbi:hypothetical protein Tco_0347524 [Tanacetum coccineum]